jgi:hypothetical protein
MTTRDNAISPERARRIHMPHAHLESVFGADWFGQKAEAFARLIIRPKTRP